MFSVLVPDESRFARVRQWTRYGSPVAERMRAAFAWLSSGNPRATASVRLLAVCSTAALVFMLSPQPRIAKVSVAERAPVAGAPTEPVKIVGAQAPKGNCADQVWPYIEPRCLTRAREPLKIDAAAPATKNDTAARGAVPPQPERATTGMAPPVTAPAAPLAVADRSGAPARPAIASLTLPRARRSASTDGFVVPRGAIPTRDATIDRRTAQPDAAIDRRATHQTVEDAWADQAMEQLLEQPRRRERRRSYYPRSERRSLFGFPF